MRSGRHDGFNLEFGRIIDERGVLIELSFNIDGLHVSKHLRIGQPVAPHGIAPVVVQSASLGRRGRSESAMLISES